MKKIIASIFIGLLMLCFVGCGTDTEKGEEAKGKEDVVQITIPKSYFDYSGVSVAEAVEEYKSLGKDFCTEAKERDGELILTVTERQRERLIERNDAYIEKLLQPYYKEHKKYSFEGDEDYQKAVFSFDENISMAAHSQAVFGVTAGYGLNSILLNGSPDWSVQLEIYNCHTDKLVVEANIPHESVTYGAEEWLKSYE